MMANALSVMPLMVGTVVAAATLGSPQTVDWDKGSGAAQMSKGLPNPPGGIRPPSVLVVRPKVLFLTFDDGPSRYTS